MNMSAAVQSQYHAALEMLRRVVSKYPDALWTDPADKNVAWLLAYHALFYTHLYLHPTEDEFEPWARFRPGIQFMGPTPWPPHETPDFGEPYTRDEILEFIDVVDAAVDAILPALDWLVASGFDWLPMDKLELQFYNLRHLQSHTGELAERLWARAGIESDWVRRG